MNSKWTFGKKLAAAFTLIVALTVAMTAVSSYAMRSVVESKDRVIKVIGDNLLNAKDLQESLLERVVAIRSFMITSDRKFLTDLEVNQKEFIASLKFLKDNADLRQHDILQQIEVSNKEYLKSVEEGLELCKSGKDQKALVDHFNAEMSPRYTDLHDLVNRFLENEMKLRDQARQDSTQEANQATTIILIVAGLGILAAIILAVFLTRALGRQIGSAIQQMQSSSTELQASSNQQATSCREQVTAVHEMQATMNELLTTAKQIGESARHVAQVAGEAQAATRSGEDVVKRSQESMSLLKQQVDSIVSQMLDLGKKSHQIGEVLEIINELAEQTNILSVNATIEAAGAGELGKRFAAVADEIRSLADRVGGSTRDIRTLIEEIRSSVNATVMATESGSKTVDAGAKLFEVVTTSFGAIAGIVTNTAEAAREIELSTNQQKTAIEQVNTAVSDVSQSCQETEVSARQTLETATQLTAVSRELFQLIRADKGAAHV